MLPYFISECRGKVKSYTVLCLASVLLTVVCMLKYDHCGAGTVLRTETVTAIIIQVFSLKLNHAVLLPQ